ncbi:putative structural maintenance of chromosome (SMC) family protein [Trypanosoma theileri]|uniref:Putative structural maintenance of chromosome (SMC) family protein n=1 Tax=Trypanosoma theileri TaxID=67003 RepID=A0A1X0NY28_9TRYP|nr:putative structural maintenance of chromosome (SMC) family protein [Trypanosoma theileri]ORC89575.1 putative structural maintenance of chromosome (SMC) family protein [Trypanosoma theileri]
MALARAEGIIHANPRASTVDLSGLGLDTLLPLFPLLAVMPRLKSLKLARNKLTSLPNDLSVIRQLEYLDISENPINGLDSIMSGLSTLVVLKHLYVDLSYESEEDEIIISLQSLESFNGTSLTETLNDAEGEDRRESDDVQRLNDTPTGISVPSMRNETPRQSYPQPQTQTQVQPRPDVFSHQWSDDDTRNMQDLYNLVTEATNNVSSTREFNAYVINVVQHLNALTAAEGDAASREGETLKAKKVLYEYCLDELCRAARKKDAALGRAFTTIIKSQTTLLEQYDLLWRRIAGDKNERINVMKKDMQDAIHEIESLMAQIGHTNRGSGNITSPEKEMEMRMLQEEIGRLRTENERLQTKLRFAETTGCSPNPVSVSSIRRPSASADRSQISPSQPHVPQFGNKVLTLKQLKSTIEDIYASKSKYDIKCSESHLPRETMEQHMYTYLNQRYGLKHIILDWATAIIQGVKKYSPEENDVAVFGKILRNEIDEEFRFVQRQVRETVHELLRIYIKGKRPTKSDMEIEKIVQKKVNSTILEDEWVDIVKYMYNTEDAVSLIMQIRDHLRQISQPHRRRAATQKSQDIAGKDEVRLPYMDFVHILLDFQLKGHERFLARFLAIFRQHDHDRNGIVNAQEFAAILKSLDASKTDEDVNAVLELIDPFGNQLITYSECVTFLSNEIVKMMKASE